MKRPLIVIVAAVAVLGLAGCSKAAQSAPLSNADQTSAPSGATGAPGGGAPGGSGGGRFPGVSGLVAAVTGATAQVQGATQQTAVTWTRTTRFTDQVAVSPSALRVGVCVMARPARAAGGLPGGSGTAGTAVAGSAAPVSVAAATVELFPKQGTACTFGFGARNGAGQSGSPGGAPTPLPTVTGSTAPDDGRGGIPGSGRRAFGALGMITAVGSGQFTVTPTVRLGAMPTRPVTVTYSSSTTFTRLTAATSAAVKVGICLTAQGRTDDTGALTAASVTVSAPTKGTCQTGFGRGLGAGQGAGNGPGAGAGRG